MTNIAGFERFSNLPWKVEGGSVTTSTKVLATRDPAAETTTHFLLICVQMMLYVYARCIYSFRLYKRKSRGSVSRVSASVCMYMTLTLVFDVCIVQDTMKRILILCFFTRAPAVSVVEFKRWNLFQRPASLYSLYLTVLMLNLYMPTSENFSAFSFQLYWNAYYRCYRKVQLHTTGLHILIRNL